METETIKTKQVRYNIPEHIHEKLIRYQRKLQLKKNIAITQEQALIELISKIKI